MASLALTVVYTRLQDRASVPLERRAQQSLRVAGEGRATCAVKRGDRRHAPAAGSALAGIGTPGPDVGRRLEPAFFSPLEPEPHELLLFRASQHRDSELAGLRAPGDGDSAAGRVFRRRIC